MSLIIGQKKEKQEWSLDSSPSLSLPPLYCDIYLNIFLEIWNQMAKEDLVWVCIHAHEYQKAES